MNTWYALNLLVSFISVLGTWGFRADRCLWTHWSAKQLGRTADMEGRLRSVGFYLCLPFPLSRITNWAALALIQKAAVSLKPSRTETCWQEWGGCGFIGHRYTNLLISALVTLIFYYLIILGFCSYITYFISSFLRSLLMEKVWIVVCKAVVRSGSSWRWWACAFLLCINEAREKSEIEENEYCEKSETSYPWEWRTFPLFFPLTCCTSSVAVLQVET